MSSFVVYEALGIGLKEGFKIGAVWLVFSSYLAVRERQRLLRPFTAGIILSLIFSLFIGASPQGYIAREYISSFISMSFALLLISSAGALMNAFGVKLFEPFERLLAGERVVDAAVFFTSFLFFSPDLAGTSLFLRELSVMKGRIVPTYASVTAGFLLALGAFLFPMRYFRPYSAGKFFDIPQLLLFLAVVKLLGGGIKGIGEISLIPSVQRGLMKFSHDFVHQVLVMLMVPDHPLLTTTTWNFIGILFSVNLASLESLLILLFLPLMFIYYSLLKPVPEPEARSGAEKRKIKYLLLSERRRKALPVIFFIAVILGFWFSQGGETAVRLYNPKPRPVVEEGWAVTIPLSGPAMDVRDGALHKFVLQHQGAEIRLIVIKRPDNTLSVCLDACEICPPDGYGQRGQHVICIYCNTPIPVTTLGEPGGCNPIPLAASVDSKFVRVELSEILRKWEYVKSGKSKEGIK